MRKLLFFILSCLLSGIMPAQEADLYHKLKEGFITPPDKARPRVWWHWMNGNITEEGLIKDMDWMYSSGVRGFHVFDANFSTPQIVERRISYMSEEWKSIFRHVIAHADSLGMEVTVASSPGFSSSGGPWVEPGDGMKKLCWRQVDIEGGRTVELPLPEPYSTTGVYQNIERKSKYSFYEDIAVLAVRIPEEERSVAELGAMVTSSSGNFTAEMLSDGDYASGESISAGEEGYSWVQYAFQKEVTVKALTVRNSKTRGERHSNPASCIDSLQVSSDGVNFTTVAGIPLGCCLVQTFDLEPVTSKYFRLKHMNTGKPDSRIQEFALHTVPRVNHAEEKAAFGSAHDLRLFPTPAAGAGEVSPAAIDITGKVVDGILRWKAPRGRWRIIRMGCSLTGKVNHPASAEATGLEVDKLDPSAWRRYFRTFLDIMKEASGGMLGERGIQYVLEDSYEAEFQNWTPEMREEFRARRGYDPLPWMPALTGMILESSERTERFLFDWRTTLGELFCENYAILTDMVRKEYGMKGCYIEAHANGSIFPADGMAVKKTASFPMGEMWIPGKGTGAFRVTEGTADIRESASVAHIYGQEYVAAESMTAVGLYGQAWSYCPENMKRTADLEMKAGVTRFVLHDSAAQPRDDKFPGLGLGTYGHWFNRHECWASQAGAWMDYLARSSYMLSRGKNVADVLWYYGEETNLTSYYSRSFPEVPQGYEYDYVGADALLNEITCENGILRASSGAEYKVLLIEPQLTYFSDKVKAKIDELLRNGAQICGKDRKTLEEGLRDAGAAPDMAYEGEEVLNFRHRSAGDVEIYWVENQSYEAFSKKVSFRVSGRTPYVWHPEDGTVDKVVFTEKDGRTSVDLDFVSDDAFFVVFSKHKDTEADDRPSVSGKGLSISGPWTVCFQEGRRAPESIRMDSLESLSESKDPGIRYFSGTAAYKTEFTVEDTKGLNWLDLGMVKNIAEIFLNGEKTGTCWKSPFRLRVDGKLKKGRNTLEVRVTNLWPNRLIGDAQPQENNPLTFTAYKFYKADDPLLPSGLIGPVILN